MAVTPSDLANEARLLRQSGHCQQSARLIAVARTVYPKDLEIEKESKRLATATHPTYSKCVWTLSWLVDRLGLPVFFCVMALVAYLLAPIIFVPSW